MVRQDTPAAPVKNWLTKHELAAIGVVCSTDATLRHWREFCPLLNGPFTAKPDPGSPFGRSWLYWRPHAEQIAKAPELLDEFQLGNHTWVRDAAFRKRYGKNALGTLRKRYRRHGRAALDGEELKVMRRVGFVTRSLHGRRIYESEYFRDDQIEKLLNGPDTAGAVGNWRTTREARIYLGVGNYEIFAWNEDCPLLGVNAKLKYEDRTKRGDRVHWWPHLKKIKRRLPAWRKKKGKASRLTISQASEQFSLHPSKIWFWIRKGLITPKSEDRPDAAGRLRPLLTLGVAEIQRIVNDKAVSTDKVYIDHEGKTRVPARSIAERYGIPPKKLRPISKWRRIGCKHLKDGRRLDAIPIPLNLPGHPKHLHGLPWGHLDSDLIEIAAAMKGLPLQPPVNGNGRPGQAKQTAPAVAPVAAVGTVPPPGVPAGTTIKNGRGRPPGSGLTEKGKQDRFALEAEYKASRLSREDFCATRQPKIKPETLQIILAWCINERKREAERLAKRANGHLQK